MRSVSGTLEGMSTHHHHHHVPTGSATSRIQLALVMNLIFTVVELGGGWWTGSVAVLADAIHDLGDSLALGLALFLQYKALGGPSAEFSYGKRRLSLLSALMTGVLLLAGSIFIAKESLIRLMNGATLPHGLGMMGLAVVGLAANGLAAWQLAKGKTHNERLLSWHLIEDVLGWAAVLIGAVVIHFYAVAWVDPALGLIIAGVVGWNALKNLTQTMLVFLQQTPGDVDQEKLRLSLLGVRGVTDVHDLHVWSLDGEHHVVTLHAVIENMNEMDRIKLEIRHLVSHHGSVHTTIEFESQAETCAQNCDDRH
jgi:cobalt-zinc-cadmium efflux system protein